MKTSGNLARIATEYPNLSRLLTEVTLDPPVAHSDLARPPLLDDPTTICPLLRVQAIGTYDDHSCPLNLIRLSYPRSLLSLGVEVTTAPSK